jgi:alpha-methylacyl-CoA racemase
MTERSGPLVGLKVLEFARGEPAALAGMLLSDLGADVLRIDFMGQGVVAGQGPALRGRRSAALDLDKPAAVEACLRLAERADILIDGLAAGALEGLGLGPQAALARNPALVYARAGDVDRSGQAALAFGILAGLFRARDTGQGQVVDAAGEPAEPRFSVTPGRIQGPPPAPGAHTREALSDWGLERAEIDSLAAQGAI